MKSQDFFDEQLLSVIDGQGVGWTLRVQVRAGADACGCECEFRCRCECVRVRVGVARVSRCPVLLCIVLDAYTR